MNKNPSCTPQGCSTFTLALGALGVVYGDIGTSPLYAIKECFHGIHAVGHSQANILGVLSLVFWSLTMVVTIKYVWFILKADNKGEGGIFSLLELLPARKIGPKAMGAALMMALFGSALLYGDGIITPAISVLSAVEGLEVATAEAAPLVVPLTLVVLLALFMIQRHGTAGIGRVFGPVMIVWFLVIGGLGLVQIVDHPDVLLAVNPAWALDFFVRNRLHGMVVLGSVVLCITGGEALYADMGHFGRKAIRISWLWFAFPALLLNYLGQGAGLLANPAIVSNPFYGIVPPAALFPMVALSTMATIIASQAMISGVFSLTRQAVQLGYFPRVRVIHTSSLMEGQIYIPEINSLLMWACTLLVLAFRSSDRLAAAYGIAVTATMAITSALYYYVARKHWGWPQWKALPLLILFLGFDLTYFGANLLKVADGGWFTLAIATAVMACMVTWKDGRKALSRALRPEAMPMEAFLADVARTKPYRTKGAAVFLSVSPKGVPVTLLHFFKHAKILHEAVVILSLSVPEVPYVADSERLTVTPLGENFFRLIAQYGFMETPNVPHVMELARAGGVNIDAADTTFFLGRESLLLTGPSKLFTWRKRLFEFMSRNSRPATAYFGIPPGQVMELGVLVEL